VWSGVLDRDGDGSLTASDLVALIAGGSAGKPTASPTPFAPTATPVALAVAPAVAPTEPVMPSPTPGQPTPTPTATARPTVPPPAAVPTILTVIRPTSVPAVVERRGHFVPGDEVLIDSRLSDSRLRRRDACRATASFVHVELGGPELDGALVFEIQAVPSRALALQYAATTAATFASSRRYYEQSATASQQLQVVADWKRPDAGLVAFTLWSRTNPAQGFTKYQGFLIYRETFLVSYDRLSRTPRGDFAADWHRLLEASKRLIDLRFPR
jgi:hypothetical protein